LAGVLSAGSPLNTLFRNFMCVVLMGDVLLAVRNESGWFVVM
jgi:hypothetical protein